MKSKIIKKIIGKKFFAEHVTISPYWQFIGKPKIENNYYFIRKIFFFLNITLKKFFSIKISKIQTNNESYSLKDKTSYITSKSIKKFRLKLLSIELKKFFNKLKINAGLKNLQILISEHDKFYFNQNLIQDNYGGLGYNNSLLLFAFTKLIKPSEIIESGVWKGFTTLIFDKASQLSKKICFDINFSKLTYKSRMATYINSDISEYKFNDNFSFDLCMAFFDDHVSQYDRFIFCKNKNIPYIVFDDDNDFLTVHNDGWPSIPTISMVKNIYNFKSQFSWRSLGRKGTAKYHRINPNVLNGYWYSKAPDLFKYTGHHNMSPLSILIKKKI